MATVIVSVNVAYPKEFLRILDESRAEREAAGESSFRTCGEPNVPNQLYFIGDWPDLNRASEFWLSGAGDAHMARWNSVEKPSPMVLEDYS